MWSPVLFLAAFVQTAVPAADVAADAIQSTLERMKAESITDVPIRTIDAGGHNVGVAVIYRPAAPAIGGGAVHSEVTEVYYIIEGRGTLVTAGRWSILRSVSSTHGASS